MNETYFQELAELFTKAHTRQEMKMLLLDILTPQEIEKLIERLQIIKMLAEGNSQRAIKKKLKVSIALVTRGSHALQNNHGGFPLYLKHFLNWRKGSSF